MPNCKHHHGGHGHSHSHGANNESYTADLWTKSGAAIGGLTSYLTNTFWVAELVDTAFSLEASAIGVSYYGAAVGLTVGFFIAAGDTYSHYNLNREGQHVAANDTAVTDTEHPESSSEEENRLTSPINVETVSQLPNVTPVSTGLTHIQKASLVLDCISHAGEIAGPLTFVYELATANAALPGWVKKAAIAGTTTIGFFGSISDVRTCRTAFIKANEHAVAANNCQV